MTQVKAEATTTMGNGPDGFHAAACVAGASDLPTQTTAK